jgi:exosortase
MNRSTVAAPAMVLAAVMLIYAPVVSSLVRQWGSDENYSHGFLVAPCALLLAWQSRRALQSLPLRPRGAGLLVVVVSILLLTAGRFGAELFITRISLIGVIAGTVLFLYGAGHVRLIAFPLLLLLLVIPLPEIVINRIAFPLQLLASRTAEGLLSGAGVPVVREGNVLVLPRAALEVAQACSGIRSLASLVALALIVGRLRFGSDRRQTAARALLTTLAVPIAVLANVLRVAGTGFAAVWIGPQAADGFFHAFSGWLMFVVAVLGLFASARMIEMCRQRLHPARLRVSVGLP